MLNKVFKVKSKSGSKKTIKAAMIKRKLSLSDLLEGLEEERRISYKKYLSKDELKKSVL